MANAKPTKVNGHVEEATGRDVNSTVDAKGNPTEIQSKVTKSTPKKPKNTVKVNSVGGKMVRKDY